MSLNYRIIQFSDDPIRGEFRNIAVFIDDGDHYQLRTVDSVVGPENIESFSLSLLSRLPAYASESVSVWFEYLRALTRDEKAVCDEVHRELDRLDESDGQIIAFERGVVERTTQKELSDVADWLARRLLGDATDFDGAVREFMRASELEYMRGFEWNAHFSTSNKYGRPQNAVFDFGQLRRDGRWFLGKTLRLRYRTNSQVTDAVNAVLASFNLAEGIGELARNGAFVLSERIPTGLADAIASLKPYVHWLDVTAADSPGEMHRLWTVE